MERIDVDGTTIRVQRQGSGRPLVYLHSGSGEVGPLPFFAELEARGFSVIAPEFPGSGTSDPAPGIRGIEDAVYFLRRVLDTLGVTDAVLCGSSLGGWLAAELAVWFPDRAAGLVLIDAVGLYLPDAPIMDIFIADMDVAMAAANPHGADVVSPLLLGLETEFDGSALVTLMMRGQAVAAQIGWSPYMHDPKLEARLPTVNAPTLVLWGADDGIAPRAHGERYAERIPDANLVVLEKTGHTPALEKPAEVAELIASMFG